MKPTILEHIKKIRRLSTTVVKMIEEDRVVGVKSTTEEIANLALELDHAVDKYLMDHKVPELKPDKEPDQGTIPGVEDLKSEDKPKIDGRYGE